MFIHRINENCSMSDAVSHLSANLDLPAYFSISLGLVDLMPINHWFAS